ncbi:rhomboid family intramembrane serine protease [Aureibacter tunicatorum]|uniref:Membrane associated rhomboid family serine protease n=1 Tax=Aureibacter tunicatorum TaxID=866807 RepID=A0AAE3XJL0_9BACT|nr:rhomboid family intramembrane serine protease [Aureibacter tunicatorum]MDR6238082.1 membrane associated rhomboid family serine protease [Aureibacter tunicatorum]BDD03115.1 rhomboid family intramembrane serine protease [Aureibacter tunicatorum]
MFTITPTVRNLLIINLLIFLSATFFHWENLLVNLFGLRYIFSPDFQAYQLLTYMFLQVSFGHFFGNMLALFFFGPILEMTWGAKRFLFYYLATGMAAGVIYSGVSYLQIAPVQNAAQTYYEQPTPENFDEFMAKYARRLHVENYSRFMAEFEANPNSQELINSSKENVNEIVTSKINTITYGASAVVFAILLAFAVLFPDRMIYLLIPPIPIKAKYLVGLYGAYELYAGIKANPDDIVAHFAHLSGMLAGYLILRYWKKQNGHFY